MESHFDKLHLAIQDFESVLGPIPVLSWFFLLLSSICASEQGFAQLTELAHRFCSL